jgi:cytochrome c oxidase subunit 4
MEGKAATPPVLLRVFVALIVLLLLTIAGSYLPLGLFGLAVALGIAGAKALLILLFFMQVRYKSGLTKVFVGTGFFWLAILFTLTLADYLSRGAQSIPGK